MTKKGLKKKVKEKVVKKKIKNKRKVVETRKMKERKSF